MVGCEAEILRGTTMTTRLLSCLAEQIGTEYIQRTLHPVFLRLSEEEPPDGSSYELNPSKLKGKENLDQNMINVSCVANLILDAICTSADNAPRLVERFASPIHF